MSARMQFPLSQRRHTNIAVVRYSKNGVKLEIACYKNKVISYRSGTETRLDEVLQVERIFTNVGRGHLASEKEVETVFGNDMTEQQAIKFMLDHGELQVAQQERTAEVDEIFKDVAIIISQKCVNSKTQHPFPPPVIEQALRSIGAAVKLDQPVKKQALGLIRALIEADIIPIARANMKIRCTTTSAAAVDKLRLWCGENDAEVVENDPAAAAASAGATHSLLLVMQPSLFRDLDTFVKEELPAGSATHMIDAAVTEVGEGGDLVLDANAVSRANAHHGGGAIGGAATPSVSSGTAGGRVGGRTGATSSAGKDTDKASSISNTAEGGSRSATKGRGGAGKGGKKGRHAQHNSSDDDDDSDDGEEKLSLAERAKRHAADSASRVDDLTAELQRLRADDDNSDDDDAAKGGRGGKAKKNKKKAAAGAGGKKGSATQAPVADDDDESDDGGRKGKSKKNKKKKAAAVPEKAEPEVEEAFSESDEELMVNRKQRAKKQQQEAQQEGNNWDDEEEFDYGDDEEEETQA